MNTRAESDVLAESRPASTTVRTLGGILITGCVMGLVAADWYVGGQVVFSALLAVLVAVALWELYRLAERAGARPAAGFGIAAGVVLVVAQWLRDRCAAADVALPLDPLVTIATMTVFGAVAAHVARRGVQRAWTDLGATVLALALVWFPAMCIAWIRGLGVGPLVLFVATVKLSDVAAYAVGRTAGRRRLAPVISPNKTVAGAAAALIGGPLAAVAFRLWWPAACAGLSVAAIVLFGVVVAAFGMLGDLGESVLKRAASAKDASALVPGFGGVLDVLDSLWGAAPVAYVTLVLLGT